MTELDSVRENLNGFWIPKTDRNGQEILWLNFESNKYLADWKTIPYTDEIKQTEILPYKSCTTIVTLIKVNGKVQMQFVSLGGQDTTKIDQLTKTKLKIDGITYLKHKGYEFLR
ncbi:hypothetical protein ABW636_13215 [Aquimarina sp. 2201CG1-2-11]|uniref:hypothetical protein n=1 Tax=Aquimarina discodermiae TaxID=3231043 RepID=UPI00346378AB